MASAGVILAKKAGLPQLVAGSIWLQGVALPPHSKFVVFTAPPLALAKDVQVGRLFQSRVVKWFGKGKVTHGVW